SASRNSRAATYAFVSATPAAELRGHASNAGRNTWIARGRLFRWTYCCASSSCARMSAQLEAAPSDCAFAGVMALALRKQQRPKAHARSRLTFILSDLVPSHHEIWPLAPVEVSMVQGFGQRT